MKTVTEVFTTENVIAVLLGIFVTLMGRWYYQYRKNYSFWSSRGVDGPTPLPFFGNFHLYMINRIPDIDYKLGMEYGRIYGVYEGKMPVLMIWDPKIVEKIFISDHNSFKLQMGSPSNDPIFNNQIFFLEGEQLKRIRGVITSALTGSKLKQHFEQIQFDDLKEFLSANIGEEINFSTMFHIHMLNVVTRHFFGLDLDLFKNQNHELVSAAHGFGFTATKIFLMRNFPRLTGFINRKMQQTHDFLLSFTSYAVDQRMKILTTTNANPRRDLLQTMVDGNLSDIQLKANSIAMVKAGFGTTQTTLCYLSYEIAKNVATQKKVQGEIDKVLANGHDLTYEDLNNLPFLDACFTEVLRLHPVDFRTFRRATIAGKIPYTDIDVPINQLIKVPLHSLHFDPELFEDPFEFKPERWIDSPKIEKCAFLAFGAGPRMCPGSHFASLNAKLVMINILSHYTMEISSKTCMDVPMGRFAAAPEDLWIKLTSR